MTQEQPRNAAQACLMGLLALIGTPLIFGIFLEIQSVFNQVPIVREFSQTIALYSPLAGLTLAIIGFVRLPAGKQHDPIARWGKALCLSAVILIALYMVCLTCVIVTIYGLSFDPAMGII